MADESTQSAPDIQAAAKPAKPVSQDKAPAAAKGKAKEPGKPFQQLIAEDVIPATVAAFQSRGVDDLYLALESFTLKGTFGKGRREFSVMFSEADVNSLKAFTCTTDGAPVSTVESFMIDERKVPPELLVFYIVQRIYAQQWF
jgi:hypothetical protein